MNIAKHTAGPWFVVEHLWSNTSVCSASSDNAVCGLDINHATEESQEADEAQMAADARLIAAAPDLMEAARAAMICIGELSPTQARVETMQALQAALEKAGGGE